MRERGNPGCGYDPEWVEQQVAEDTCKAHGRFCCPSCFDIPLPASREDITRLREIESLRGRQAALEYLAFTWSNPDGLTPYGEELRRAFEEGDER